jgi:hypothetical protein
MIVHQYLDRSLSFTHGMRPPVTTHNCGDKEAGQKRPGDFRVLSSSTSAPRLHQKLLKRFLWRNILRN